MTHLDQELQFLKNETTTMWQLVIQQLDKTHQALSTFDRDLAREVIANEKRVNGHELKIDLDCENIFALFNPVAVDLRFVLAILKINNNLERTGDIAEGIARYIVQSNEAFDEDLLKAVQLHAMYLLSMEMLNDVLNAFENEDTFIARKIFNKDEKLDLLNDEATKGIIAYIQEHPEQTPQALYTISVIRKLERVGDQCKNIAEEIIFYLEAKVLKHLHTKTE